LIISFNGLASLNNRFILTSGGAGEEQESPSAE